ncbi:hypothetical protein KKB40_02290 [Patescibacteria group bacterium]|nr:hypothetical protein [Patescibacteria group bacterium]
MKFRNLIFTLLVIGLVLSLIFLPERLIKISSVECKNQYGQCTNSIVLELENAQGRSLHRAKKRVEQILSNQISIRDYSIQFKLPTNLEINLIEKKPKFALVDKNNSWTALLDETGEVILLSDSTNLPHVLVDMSEPNLGYIVKNDLLFALEIMSDMYFSYQTQNGVLENNSLVIELDRGIKVIFPLDGEGQVLLGSLNLILSQVEEENTSNKTIDLRFKNPVIK